MTVQFKEINAKSILRKHKRLDSWFVARYGMNLYRGCEHDCVYCDGRAEKYNVTDDFSKMIGVKTNAVDILKRELDPARKRTPLKKSFIMLGGGVGDSYQQAEATYRLTRSVLELLYNHDFPIHILTKSTLIERDLDILKKINSKTRVITSFSFSSANDTISSKFEPGAALPSAKLAALTRLKNAGFRCGVFLMPVIPFITDSAELIEETISKAKAAGVDFIIFSGMTIKEGKQKDYFYNLLETDYPHLIKHYDSIYTGNKWGGASEEYYHNLHVTFSSIIKKYAVPARIPVSLCKDFLDENDLVAIILDQMDYLAKLHNRSAPYGYASYSIAQLQQPVSELKNQLQSLKGVGAVTERIILEILKTGTSQYYEKLLYWEL